VDAQNLDGLLVERDRSVGCLGLWVAVLDLLSELHKVRADEQLAAVQVEGVDFRSGRFASTQARVGDEVIQSVEPVLHGPVEELSGLLADPDHHP